MTFCLNSLHFVHKIPALSTSHLGKNMLASFVLKIYIILSKVTRLLLHLLLPVELSE